jgi:DNA-3-methyladenine glycosylase I
MPSPSVIAGDDKVKRCFWAYGSDLYCHYHDTEWGRPTKDDRWIFEKLCLEGFQAGLSWLTILNKRENFRKAFKNFNVEDVSRFNQKSVERLLQDAGIVRHRGKIESAIHNAKMAKKVRAEFGSLAALVWQYEPDPKSRPKKMTRAALYKLAQTPESKALSKDLKKRGFTFVGPTTVYAFMQAAGMVNDHLEGCAFRGEALSLRKKFKKP